MSYQDWDQRYVVERTVATQQAAPEEPSVKEDAEQMSTLFQRVMNKALAASDLAKQVQGLQEQISQLQGQVEGLSNQLQAERESHTQTKTWLSDVTTKLNQRESTIHDLVQERDIVVEERNAAQTERDTARRESNDWQARANQLESDLEKERQRTQELTDQLEAMKQRVTALKDAFTGLHNL